MRILLTILMAAVLLLNAGCTKKFRLNRKAFLAGEYALANSSKPVTFEGKLDLIWEESSSGKPVGPLSIYGSNLVLPESKKRFRFHRLKDGHYEGKVPSYGFGQTGLKIADSMAFFAVGPTKSQLSAANLFNGKSSWRQNLKDACPGSIIVNSTLVISSTDGRVMALDLSDGSTVWKYQADQRLAAPPALSAAPVSNQQRIFQPGDQGRLFVLSAEDGSEVYRVDLEAPIVAEVVFGPEAFLVDVRGNLYVLEPTDGKVIWKRNVGSSLWAAPALSRDKVVLTNSAGYVLALRKSDGEELWRYDLDEAIRTSPVILGDYVVVAATGGTVVTLSLADGKLIDETEVKGAVDYTPVSDGNFVYLATDRGRIICLGNAHGNETTNDQRSDSQD